MRWLVLAQVCATQQCQGMRVGLTIAKHSVCFM
jgi:hypothetical protein